MKYKFELKAFQRVQLANGARGIVIPRSSARQNTSREEFCIALQHGSWSNADYECDVYRIVKVWDKPAYYSEVFDFNSMGDVLYDESSVKRRVEEMKAQRDLLNNEIAKLEEGLDA